MQQGLFAKYAIICHSKTLLLRLYEKHCRRDCETKTCKNSALFILKVKKQNSKKLRELEKWNQRLHFLAVGKEKRGLAKIVTYTQCLDVTVKIMGVFSWSVSQMGSSQKANGRGLNALQACYTLFSGWYSIVFWLILLNSSFSCRCHITRLY